MTSSEDIHFILEKGILAPSADNLQPWRFDVRGNDITIHFCREEVQSYCDTGLLAPFLSVGAVVENMRLAASTRGLNLSCHYLPDSDAPLKAAQIRLFSRNEPPDEQAAYIEKRHTNRRFYQKDKSIPPEVVEAFKERAEAGGCRLQWIPRTDSFYKELAAVIGEADQLRFEIKRLHGEFMNVLRFSEKETLATQDGLSLKSLDAGPSASVMFPIIRDWGRLQFLNKLGMSYSFNLYARMQMLSSSGAGLITAKGKSPRDFAQGGEAVQRVWHQAAKDGVAIQPMEGLPIFLIDLDLTGAADLARKQKNKLLNLKNRFQKIFALNDEDGLIFFFRAGYALPPSDRSLRRPIESFILNGSSPVNESLTSTQNRLS